MRIEIPKFCPCCEAALELVQDQLFCRNSSCSAQLNKKLEHFAKGLSIKGFGPKTIEKLNLSDIPELYTLTLEQLTDSLGSEKVAAKLLDEIERSKTADLATVIASFSIPLIGNTAANKLTSVVNDISEINAETCKQAGLGDKATNNLLNWINTEYQDLKEFLPFSFKSSTKPNNTETQLTICITGKLSSFKTKAEATIELNNLGFKVVESVTKNLNYLVDEQNKESSKRKKAEEYQIPVITNLINFLEEIKHVRKS